VVFPLFGFFACLSGLFWLHDTRSVRGYSRHPLSRLRAVWLGRLVPGLYEVINNLNNLVIHPLSLPRGRAGAGRGLPRPQGGGQVMRR